MIPVDVDAVAAAYLSGDDPLPDPQDSFVGDGDYRAIGAEYLKHFVNLGGLKPSDRVFEIGCGIGRMALPLRRYLNEQGRYHGMDVVNAGIDWCQSKIAAHDERFTFSRSDFYHPLYNPEGRETATSARFPAEDGSVDFIIATSLFTHLSRGVFERYLSEAARILADGGRLFATFFLINSRTRDALCNRSSRYNFDLLEPGPLFRPSDSYLLQAIAVDEGWLVKRSIGVGLNPLTTFRYGFWPYDDPKLGLSYQDICIFARCGSRQRKI